MLSRSRSGLARTLAPVWFWLYLLVGLASCGIGACFLHRDLSSGAGSPTYLWLPTLIFGPLFIGLTLIFEGRRIGPSLVAIGWCLTTIALAPPVFVLLWLSWQLL